MLGGSFWVAFLRNGIGAGLMMTVFLLLDRPKVPMKKAILYYVLFGCFAVVCFSLWYALGRESYIRFSGIAAIPATGGFCIFMSRDKLYLSFYKIALGFYLLALTVFCGIDASRAWFFDNRWVDIVIRIIMTFFIILIIAKKVRYSFLEGVDMLEEEMDVFSIAALFVSIVIAAFVAMWPGDRTFSRFNIVRTLFLLIMAGLIQYMMFRMYLHQGKEHRYRIEKELLEMNEQLLHCQLELMRESEEEAIRIRHDIRHHCLLIEELIKNEENDKLFAYVQQYREDVGNYKMKRICCNETINGILTAYGRYAKEEKIKVTMDVKTEKNLAVRDVDLVAVLANIFENAIHGCQYLDIAGREIRLSIIQREKKIAIQCKNTCAEEVKFYKGLPKSASGNSIGVSSILNVVAHYNGEADFFMQDDMFVARILMNIP